jgi:hypothetical protein
LTLTGWLRCDRFARRCSCGPDKRSRQRREKRNLFRRSLLWRSAFRG